jgi:hypothetical protein
VRALGASIVGFVVALAASGAAWAGGPLAAAGCTTHVYPGLQPRHLTDIHARPSYNSFPPTSGPHYASPAVWGIYTSSIPQIVLVHNLEHGGIVIQYGAKVSQRTLRQLTAWYNRDPNALVIALLPQLGAKIAVTAWNEPPYQRGRPIDPGHGYLALCSSFDPGAFTSFVRAHRYKSGERFPPSILAPGH